MTTGYEQHSGDVKDTALSGAAETKDVLMDRGGDTVAVAKDELAQLAQEARGHAYNLWSQTTDQLREHALEGTHQLAGVLHDLSGELGHLASRSEQNGPVTAFARQASARGGAFSHWLSNADVDDLLLGVRRFARRRPFAFLVGAATAGVLAGRLSRGLVADHQASQAEVTPGSAGSARHAIGDRTGGMTMSPPPVAPSAQPAAPASQPVPGAAGTTAGTGAPLVPPVTPVAPGTGTAAPLSHVDPTEADYPAEAGYGEDDLLMPDERRELR
ncbi:MAG TPA: hypothetical protein VLS51_10905 [Propionibacteriaceae bacterium]|nr:hypothetical protein [Propionibacteriaceae bacterium]